jgi:hypothetical protein
MAMLVVLSAATVPACSSVVSGHGGAVSPSRTTGDFPSNSGGPAVSAARPSGPSQRQLLSRFGGKWGGHGRGLSFTGPTGDIAYRIYKWCADDSTPPCDEMQGNEIIDGGRIGLRLDRAYEAGTATVAEGIVTSSTDPAYAVGEPVTARVQSQILSLSIFPGAPFCGPHLPPSRSGECGA